MFLKPPKASTDQRVRSLLQKAARRGYAEVVGRALEYLHSKGDKTWLRSRAIVITFEECWPLAADLFLDKNLSSKRRVLDGVTKAVKQKDAAGLGALAYAYHEGDESMLDCVPDRQTLRIISEALNRPPAFFDWVITQTRGQETEKIVKAARSYLPAATWEWDKATILAAALLATAGPGLPSSNFKNSPIDEFPYWIALDKHTPEGKAALTKVAKEVNTSYRRLIWASFYFESACVNELLPSPWWEAEKRWRLRRAGLSLDSAEQLWFRARPLLTQRLATEAAALKSSVVGTGLVSSANQQCLI
jgi:hypothetical protein